MIKQREYRFPVNTICGLSNSLLSFSGVSLLLIAAGASVDLILFGVTADTPIPYNYPFFLDILLLISVIIFLRLTHRVMWNIVGELETIVRFDQDDPLSLSQSIEPEAVWRELGNVLHLAFHPIVIALGGILGGVFVFSIMSGLGVFDAYPYLIMNFGFGVAHGVFFGPAIGGLYLVRRAQQKYVVDINLLDPDGVGGYRQIGDGIVKLGTYGILFITLDFIILSSVAFTRYTDFQFVVSVIYVTVLIVFVLTIFYITLSIRQELLEIRDLKIKAMQSMFVVTETNYWSKLQSGDENLSEAINLLSMYAVFHQMNSMNMWPINLYSLMRLALSLGFSLLVYVVEFIGVESIIGNLSIL